jgi:hypothetical protein
MTAATRRPARFGRLLFWMRWGGALAAAGALILLSLPGVARAEGSGYDPVTGGGTTASSVVVPWTQGLLDANNNPITSANADRNSSSPTSPLSFMYKDFQTLQVTVSQTQDITHQGITVKWTGGLKTVLSGFVQADFLQMMECYGDSPSGPAPEQCEYGSNGLLPAGSINPHIGGRTGSLCAANSVPSVDHPALDANGSTFTGCDTLEPGNGISHLAPCPGPSCSPGSFTIPFAPASDPTNLDYASDTTYFSQFSTNEIQEAVTAQDGSGQQQFETLTSTQASGLGCGQLEANGQPRGCWLVIVPRGEHEPNGRTINRNSLNDALQTSPLSASNWAQRIQIHLSYAPLQPFCKPGTLERQTVGTQLITRAMQSWQLALNQAANCAKIYAFTATSEPASTQAFTGAASDGTAGLAFTTIPIGSEVTRSSGTLPTLPPILYAPVAVSALDFGFNINVGNGFDATPVKLSPELLAEALTQSYQEDVPNYPNSGGNPANPPPTWPKGNPFNISTDPQFLKVNQPNAPTSPTGPIAPLVILDHTALAQQVWQWIQGDSAASGWLDGTAGAGDPNVTVDPDYQALNLGKSPAIDSFPRAYKGCFEGTDKTVSPPKPEERCSGTLLSYVADFDSAAAAVLAANNPNFDGSWSDALVAPDNSLGWWGKHGIEPLGQIFMWGEADTSDLAAYGLTAAQLCDDAGTPTSCVSPTSASLGIALSNAKQDSGGLLHVDPAQPGNGGYPLVDVTYAAVRTDQSPAALNDYAALIAYAAGQGQAIGAAAGNLAPGYLPMPANLQSQAQAVVTQLQALASGSPSPSPSASQSPTTGATTSTGPAQGGNATTPAATTGTGTTGTGTTGTGTTGTGTTGGGATPRPTSGITPTAGTTPALAGLPSLSSSCSPSPSHSASPSRSPTPSCSPSQAGGTSPGGPVTSLPPAEPVAGTTPAQVVGAIRWVLIAVVIVGTACAAAGTLLRSGQLPPWLRLSSGQTPPWLRRRKLD